MDNLPIKPEVNFCLAFSILFKLKSKRDERFFTFRQRESLNFTFDNDNVSDDVVEARHKIRDVSTHFSVLNSSVLHTIASNFHLICIYFLCKLYFSLMTFHEFAN